MPPVLIGGVVLGAVALGVWLLSRSAAADEPGPAPKPIVKIKVEKPTPIEKPIVVAPVIVSPPRPGMYYRIVEGDTGSAIALKAYGAARPTAAWLHVAAHPRNAVRLARNFTDWFLPRWTHVETPETSAWLGMYTGSYAVIYLPLESEF
jgi:hypothetical protein